MVLGLKVPSVTHPIHFLPLSSPQRDPAVFSQPSQRNDGVQATASREELARRWKTAEPEDLLRVKTDPFDSQ